MRTRREFCKELAKLEIEHAERAIALLWYYQKSGDYEERTAEELANDLHDEGYPKPNITRLRDALRDSVFTTKGKRKETFQLDIRRVKQLDDRYSKLLDITIVEVTDSILSSSWLAGTNRKYLSEMIRQINGTYQLGFYDACGVLCRRLMESLIIEVYIFLKREDEIKNDGVFVGLENLIQRITNNRDVNLSRGSDKVMREIKQLGDTAAHHRNYLTTEIDISDIKVKYRTLIYDLLVKANIIH